jgi:hypothetical protein
VLHKRVVLREPRQIPGVGESIAADLWDLGFRSVLELKNKDPEELYRLLCAIKGVKVDRCMLYVLRCAVYYASNKTHDPELLKWWRWKNRA